MHGKDLKAVFLIFLPDAEASSENQPLIDLKTPSARTFLCLELSLNKVNSLVCKRAGQEGWDGLSR